MDEVCIQQLRQKEQKKQNKSIYTTSTKLYPSDHGNQTFKISKHAQQHDNQTQFFVVLLVVNSIQSMFIWKNFENSCL